MPGSSAPRGSGIAGGVSQQPSPTVRRRELSERLKQLRVAAGVTAEEAAGALGCSTDKIHWMERAGWTDPKWRDVRDLLDRYGVTDTELRSDLIELAKSGGERDWWQPYGRTLSRRHSKYSSYLGLEGSASGILTYDPAIVTGLLQTDDYARALLAAGPDEIDGEEIEERVALRAERRRRILAGDGSARLRAVVDEAALRRAVGGPDVMRAQVAHLIEMAAWPNIVLQVAPFSAGANPALSGACTLLQFDAGYPDVAYVEAIGGELLIDNPDGVERYRRVLRRLTATAAGPKDTIALLANATAGP